MNFLTSSKSIYLLLIIFALVNLLFLTNFPFVHSDEAWLSGLSRTMLQKKDLSVTESFFDLYPRNPHSIKTLFHLLQIVFLKLIGYKIFTFRLLSLLIGSSSLYIFYKIAKKLTDNDLLVIMTTIMMGLDIQFIYASHFARQEIILVFIFLIALYYYLDKYEERSSIRGDFTLALILGTAIGIHPNSFIIALPFVFIYSYNLIIAKKIDLANYLTFIGTLGGIALLFVILSFKFDPNFINNYSTYGEKLGVFSSILTKIDRLDYFYKKLFYGISGTYYTPPVKFQFIIFALTLISSFLQLFFTKDKKKSTLILTFAAINIGYIIIGRYNQTSIIFIFPICYLLLLNLISNLKNSLSYLIMIAIIAVLAFNTTSALIEDSHSSYHKYLKEISKVVDRNDRVLANLNCEYYFNNGKLLDYRNLAYLDDNHLSFSEYISSRKIEYIIYPEEMDYIYEHRPMWNMLYGNLYPYYQDMKNYLKEECTMVYSFTDSTYGMRIARYIGEREWQIKIYKVN